MSESLAAFYRGKRVLVTGHTGFKGAWLCRWLKLLGAEPVGLALEPDQSPSLFDLAGIGQDLSSVIGDVRNAELVLHTFEQHQPELVIHLAAQALVRRSYRDPLETFATNVMGTANVLDASRKSSSVRSVVIVTSDKCYENREWVWGYRENDPMGGNDPYSASKGCAELVTAAFQRSFFAGAGAPGVASARAGNVIGGGDWSEDRLLPDIVRGVAAGQPIVIRNPASTRPWQHVLEPLAGYLTLAQRLHQDPTRYSGGWNFGPNGSDVLNVGELAQRFIRTLGRGSLEMPPPNQDAPHEARSLALDCSKAQQLLDWAPRLNADQALRLTADWYRGHLEQPGAERALLDQQIHDYAGLLT